jgi:hypothetical protein
VEDVLDEPLAAERVAGIDIGKAMVMVTVRVPGTAAGGRRRQETREFGTTRRELLALAAWLREWDVERAGMESTSVIFCQNKFSLCFRRSGLLRTRP